MGWQPSNEPVRYERKRVAQLAPIQAEIEKLGLPLVRLRKLNGIRNALEMQIEDGGDSPEVNKLLLDALRAGILHQVNRRQARTTKPIYPQPEKIPRTARPMWPPPKPPRCCPPPLV